jgi:hypothetical protein
MLGRRLLLIFLAVAVAFIIVDGGVLLAQSNGGVTGAGTIMENSMEVSKISEEAMDKMWEDIFSDSSSMYQAVIMVATGFLGVFFLLTILPILNDAGDFNWRGVGSRFAWIIVVAVLIGNDAAMLRGITVGTRNLINTTTTTILSAQVGQITMRDALNDVILSENARATISLNMADCEAKEGVQQIECFRKGAEAAQAEIQEAADNGFWSPGTRRAASSLKTTVGEFRRLEAEAAAAQGGSSLLKLDGTVKGIINYALQGTSQAASNQLLKSIQQMFVFAVEIAMLLTGLLGPLAAAASLIPTNPRSLYIWGVMFITIGFVKLSYNILISFCAIWVVLAERQGSGDFSALLIMSIGAPAIAIALSSWGGMSVLNAMATSAGTAISMVPIPGVAVGGGGSPAPPPAPKT